MVTAERIRHRSRRAWAANWSRSRALALAPAAILLILYALLYVRFAGRLVFFPFGLDQGEGTDAWSAWLIARGQFPYSFNGAAPYFSINYPPLWSALVALPMTLGGPGLAPARAFAALIALLDAALIGAAAWRLTRTGVTARDAWVAGLLAAGLFLASPYVFHTTPLARLNSTLVLFTLLALSCVEQPTRRRAGLAVGFLLATAFTKPTGLVTAAAALVWLIAVRPRVGLVATAAVAALGTALIAGLNTVTGGAFWLNVVAANSGAYEPEGVIRYLLNVASIHPVLLTFAVTQRWYLARCRHWSPWPLALGASLIEGSLVGHAGAGESYFLNAIAVASVLAGAAIVRIVATLERDPPPRPAWGLSGWRARVAPLATRFADPITLLGAVLLAQSLLMAHGAVSRYVPQLPDRGVQAWILGREPSLADHAAGAEIIELIRSAPGPVLSEEPSFALAARQSPSASASHLRDLDEKALWDASGLIADVERRRFGLIVLNAQRYPPAVLTAIGRSYYVTRAVPMGAATYLIFAPGA
jgi:hypothetical protein